MATDPKETAKAIIGIGLPMGHDGGGADEEAMSAAREFMKAAQGDPTSDNDVETLVHCFKALDAACKPDEEDGEEKE